MTLLLDKRHRAMLREMGVRVWQPSTPHVAPVAEAVVLSAAPLDSANPANSVAPVFIAYPPIAEGARGRSNSKTAPMTAAAAPAKRSAPTEPVSISASAAPGWQFGDAHTLYSDVPPTEGPRWLLLLETPAASLRAEGFDPLAGDAGKLLGNMLRAARLDRSRAAPHPSEAGAVLLAPLARMAVGGSAPQALASALAELVANTRPDIIVVMGRLAAQALMQSSEPLGKLRGQVHRLASVPAVITYDAAYLLRSPLEKAKAWEDLCRAADVARRKV